MTAPGPSLEDDLLSPLSPLEELAVLPAPPCELCGVPFDPNVPFQTCAGQPCLVPENEIIDWVVRVRATPSAVAPLGRWPEPDQTDSLLFAQALRLANIAGELARELRLRLVPQLGPYCPSYRRELGPLQLSARELELLQRFSRWTEDSRRGSPSLTLPAAGRLCDYQAELDAVWARVAKHLLETVCHRLQEEFR